VTADLDAARVMARITVLDGAMAELRNDISGLRDQRESAIEIEGTRQLAWQNADSLARAHATEVRSLRESARRLGDRTVDLAAALDAVVKARHDRQLGYWRDGWGRGEDRQSAEEALRADSVPDQLATKRLRNRAQEALPLRSGRMSRSGWRMRGMPRPTVRVRARRTRATASSI
jgi:hypothetical protein